MVYLPEGAPTAHQDQFAREHLPPRELWPRMDYSVLPILAAYPARINCATELLDKMVAGGFADRPVLHMDSTTWSYRQLQDRANRIARVLRSSRRAPSRSSSCATRALTVDRGAFKARAAARKFFSSTTFIGGRSEVGLKASRTTTSWLVEWMSRMWSAARKIVSESLSAGGRDSAM